MKNIIVSFGFLFLASCASAPQTKVAAKANPDMDVQLKVNGANSQLKARLAIKNNTLHEMTIADLNSRNFIVQTTDGKTMTPKTTAQGKLAAPLKIKPGQTGEVVFALQDNYAFWDRLTKYKITYEGKKLKSDPVAVWF